MLTHEMHILCGTIIAQISENQDKLVQVWASHLLVMESTAEIQNIGEG